MVYPPGGHVIHWGLILELELIIWTGSSGAHITIHSGPYYSLGAHVIHWEAVLLTGSSYYSLGAHIIPYYVMGAHTLHLGLVYDCF